MYGDTSVPEFSHIEGDEDHSLNLLATYDVKGELTGLVVNVASPSQVTENLFQLSADYRHETRTELRNRFGKSIHVLPQCSAAGDQSPHLLYDKAANQRMLELKHKTEREDIARRIADGAERILPAIHPSRTESPIFTHCIETTDIPLNDVTEEDVTKSEQQAEKMHRVYEEEMRRIEADPSLRKQQRWYVKPTGAYRRMQWFHGVKVRYEQMKQNPALRFEFHAVRLGDMVIATNPFEFYVDFGIRIKARSPAIQTFLVQLVGPGRYAPSPRTVTGGGYGSIPASNPVGPEAGPIMVEKTLEMIGNLF